jgi:hypothetical protein
MLSDAGLIIIFHQFKDALLHQLAVRMLEIAVSIFAAAGTSLP